MRLIHGICRRWPVQTALSGSCSVIWVRMRLRRASPWCLWWCVMMSAPHRAGVSCHSHHFTLRRPGGDRLIGWIDRWKCRESPLMRPVEWAGPSSWSATPWVGPRDRLRASDCLQPKTLLRIHMTPDLVNGEERPPPGFCGRPPVWPGPPFVGPPPTLGAVQLFGHRGCGRDEAAAE